MTDEYPKIDVDKPEPESWWFKAGAVVGIAIGILIVITFALGVIWLAKQVF